MNSGVERALFLSQSISLRFMQEAIHMKSGVVKFFNTQKGYGFIAPDGGGGNDVFVHVTALERAGIGSLSEGQKVRFESEPDRRTGKLAVTKIELT